MAAAAAAADVKEGEVMSGASPMRATTHGRPNTTVPVAALMGAVVMLLAPARGAPAGPPSVATALAKEEAIPVESAKSWPLPAVAAGQRVLVRIRSRTDHREFGGWNYLIQFTVNGRPVNAYLNRTDAILVNHAPSFYRKSVDRWQFWNKGDGIWLVMFSPDYTPVRGHYGMNEDDPYTYVLDITSYVTPGAQNELTVTNRATRYQQQAYKANYCIYTSVEVVFEPRPAQPVGTAAKSPPKLTGRAAVRLLDGGAFAVRSGDTELRFTSAFSQPGGGWNRFGQAGAASADPGWNIAVHRTSPAEHSLHGECDAYALDRTIRVDRNRVHVSDTVRNKGGAPVAVRHAHQWEFGDHHIPVCRIGGRPGQALNNIPSEENPTLFYPLVNSGVGLVVNDDVCRNHARFFYDPEARATGMRDDLFALDAGAAYTVSWSIYLIDTDDYFDFINQVREDWGVNYTIPGPVYWTTYRAIAALAEDKLRAILQRSDAKYLAFWELSTREPVSGWDGLKAYGNGTAIFHPAFKPELELLKQAVTKLHRVAPDVKVAVYSHSFFQGLERVDDATHRDSWITDSSGKRCRSVYSHNGFVKYQTVHPTRTNAYGRAYRKIIDFYVNDVGIDWLYWDESTGPGMTASDATSAAYATYNVWDGHTADIDPETNRIRRKYALLPLLCDDFITGVAREFRERGSFVLFNAAARTRRRGVHPCMAESQDDFGRVYMLHLASPLAYIPGAPSFADIRRRLEAGVLCIKNSLAKGSEALPRCFPFTPIALHAGWVKGRERIITCRSGEFGWPGGFSARLWRFDHNGRLLADQPAANAYADSASVDVPADGIAILERMDL